MPNITKAFIKKLGKHPSPMILIERLSEHEIADIIQICNFAYYNSGEPILSDAMYDIIKEYLEERNPKHPVLRHVGVAASDAHKKVELPYFLASLNKIKPEEKVIQKWVDKYKDKKQYVISDKLDGVSGLFIWSRGKMYLYTRGDGAIGQDISHLWPFLKRETELTVAGGKYDEVVVRGELIISKNDFASFKNKGANARNMVSGLVNAKLPDMQIANITQFVAYELIKPHVLPSEQFSLLQSLGCKCAFNKTVTAISPSSLSAVLVERRANPDFEVDGIVVTHDMIHKRVRENPPYAFAFKSIHTLETAEVFVAHVEWNMSKDGYLIPVVHFPDVNLAGVTIKRATGFNAKYILDNKIGPGSRIVIIRSGDVIPYISQVLSESVTGEAQMPDVPYVWSKTMVDIMVSQDNISQEASDELVFKNLEYFFKKVDVKGLSTGVLKKLFDGGYKTIKDIFEITEAKLLTLPGFKQKLANNIYTALKERYKTLDCLTIMDASNIFGRGIGQKKIMLILKQFPDIMKYKTIPAVSELVEIKGIEKITAQQFASNLQKLWKFMDDNGLPCIFNGADMPGTSTDAYATVADAKPNVKTQTNLSGKKIVFTGFRDAELEKRIVALGGEVTGTVSKNTSMVVAKNIDDTSTKIKKARDLNIQVLTVADFKAQYNV